MTIVYTISILCSNSSLVALGEHDLKIKDNGETDNNGEAAPVIIRGVEKIILHEDYDRNLQGGAAPNEKSESTQLHPLQVEFSAHFRPKQKKLL